MTQTKRSIGLARIASIWASALLMLTSAAEVAHAQLAEESAQIHDEVAKVHEVMKDPLLDPATVRAHAEAERDNAKLERERAARLAAQQHASD